MGMLEGKKALILGVANDHSIAWGIAQALHREGATTGFTYQGEKLEQRVRPLAQSVNAAFIEPCDVSSDEQIAALMQRVRAVYGSLDILVHSVAFAHTDELKGAYLRTSRAGFHTAMDISVYSLTALVQAAEDMLNPGAAVLTMTYHGSQQVIPNYNVMGVAKAALEASVRYLAADLGARGVRVNAISAGPMRTLSASGVSGLRTMLKHVAAAAPLRRNVTLQDVGNTAAWLCSDLAGGITGEIVYVDAGAHTVGVAGGDSTQS